MKKGYLLCMLGLAGIVFMSCSSKKIAGVHYPKLWVGFNRIGQPPYAAAERFSLGDECPQAITFEFSHPGNRLETTFIPTIFINKKYRFLHVKEMAYEYDGKQGVFLQDKTFVIPIDRYLEKDGWYWGCYGGNGWPGEPFHQIKLDDFFEDKKPGDEFPFRILLTYSFDDEEEISQTLDYDVVIVEGQYFYAPIR